MHAFHTNRERTSQQTTHLTSCHCSTIEWKNHMDYKDWWSAKVVAIWNELRSTNANAGSDRWQN